MDGWQPSLEILVNNPNGRSAQLRRVRVLRDLQGKANVLEFTCAGERLGSRSEANWYDATDEAGIVNRRGVGSVMHLHVPSIRIHRHVQKGRVVLRKVDGEQNVADI